MDKKAIILAGIGGLGAFLYYYLRGAKAEAPTGACKEGTEQCRGLYLYKCVNGQWVLAEKNSPKCGWVPNPKCKEGETVCMGYNRYVCKNGNWVLLEGNSPLCGYKPPKPAPTPIPTTGLTLAVTGGYVHNLDTGEKNITVPYLYPGIWNHLKLTLYYKGSVLKLSKGDRVDIYMNNKQFMTLEASINNQSAVISIDVANDIGKCGTYKLYAKYNNLQSNTLEIYVIKLGVNLSGCSSVELATTAHVSAGFVSTTDVPFTVTCGGKALSSLITSTDPCKGQFAAIYVNDALVGITRTGVFKLKLNCGWQYNIYAKVGTVKSNTISLRTPGCPYK